MPSSVAIGGGTSIIANPVAEHIVDLTNLELNYIKENTNEVVIGATTTITEILESEVLSELASGMLQGACKSINDVQIRNVITIGGNIACRLTWAVMPPVLMVLDANLRIVGKQKREMSIEEFLHSQLSPGDLISEVVIKKQSNEGRGAFLRFARTELDEPLISAAAFVERFRKKPSTIRVAVSGVTPPTRLQSLEDQLKGKEINKNYLREVVTKTVAQLPITESYITGEEYRRDLSNILLERTLTNLLIEGFEWK
jgi:carbon-monoxide dehydrogenase medium subunit